MSRKKPINVGRRGRRPLRTFFTALLVIQGEFIMDNEELQYEEVFRDLEKKARRKKKAKQILLFFSGFVIGMAFLGIYNYYASYFRANDLHQKVLTAEFVLKNEYLYDYDEEKMADYAVLGMTAGLNDPYTIYYPKDSFSAFNDDSNGDFVGIGIEVVLNRENNTIDIENVTKGGSADTAGIKAGDVLFKVDGEEFSGTEFYEAVSKVRGMQYEGGSVGKEVKITVKRNGEEKEFSVIREKIHTKSVEAEIMNKDIAYMKISGFKTSDGESPDTFEEFKENLEALKEKGAKKLIIDLRDNGGGDLRIVTKITDMIIPKGVLMYTEYKNGDKNYIYSDENEINMPIVVLTNGYSASASELLTGALKDYKKATVIGTKTYGKGVMQQVFPFSDGSGMVVTVAKYYTPSGVCVQDTGITPDIEIENEEEQLKKAIEILKDGV